MGNQTLQFAGVLESLGGPLAIGENHLEPQPEHTSLEESDKATIQVYEETGTPAPYLGHVCSASRPPPHILHID